jgi:type IV pilus assembly protein PilM
MEIGAGAVKALRLERDGDRLNVTAFAVIPHKKVLSTPDVDQAELTRLSLGQFISQHVLEGENLVVSVPGHCAFARFAKLPPVEPKKIPDIVKFEAVQQIPFPIDQVEWDYEIFASEGSHDVEVGIFAITRERVQQRLRLLAELGIAPQSLTLSPVAVYNAMAFDHDLAERSGAVIYLDIGTHATDVIIAEAGRCWIRTFPLGGTHFTEAIASAFKLGYAKAEKLKLEAGSSKYAKQIMQGMRPVFSDLLQDLQRSIGYYQSLHRDSKLSLMIGLGSTFKIPGLRKFLGQQLQMQVVRLDEYKRITVGGREAAEFAQHAVNMGTAYGLALQGVGLGRIGANLVPVENLRTHLWHQKTKWFAAAAAIAVAGAGMTLYRGIADRGAMERELPPVVETVLRQADGYRKQYESLAARADFGHAAENRRALIDWRRVWPHLVDDAAAALASSGPQEALLGGDLERLRSVAPKERRLVELERLGGRYEYRADSKSRRIAVTMDVELTHDNPNEFLHATVVKWLRDNAERPDVPYRIIADTISTNPGQLATFLITESGEQKAGSGPGSRAGAASSRGASGSRRPPGPPSFGGRAPPGPPAGGTIGGTGMDTSGGVSKRRPSGEKRAPPGPPAGGGGVGGAEDTAPPPVGAGRQPGVGAGQGRPAGTGDAPAVDYRNLDAIAPLPKRPEVCPPGTYVYRVPITFEVELIDRPVEPPPRTARLDGGRSTEGGS